MLQWPKYYINLQYSRDKIYILVNERQRSVLNAASSIGVGEVMVEWCCKQQRPAWIQ